MKYFSLFLFVLFPLVVFAYASPGKPSGFLNDFAELLNAEQKTNLEAKLTAFEKGTTNEISVVTIKNLGGDTVENYTAELFKEWGVGKKGQDNGVLILVSSEDRKMRIEVGYGLEGSLTDAQASAIIRDTMTPAFRANDFYGGIDGAVSQVIATIAPDYASGAGIAAPPLSAESNGGGFDAPSIFFLVLFVPLWLASILGRSKSWWAGGVLGGIAGVVLGFIFGFLYFGVIATIILIPIGLLFDFVVSRAYARSVGQGMRPPWWIGGGGRGGLGGGFGGFGGGSSGGGGASGSF